jgi:hypothetical protein
MTKTAPRLPQTLSRQTVLLPNSAISDKRLELLSMNNCRRCLPKRRRNACTLEIVIMETLARWLRLSGFEAQLWEPRRGPSLSSNNMSEAERRFQRPHFKGLHAVSRSDPPNRPRPSSQCQRRPLRHHIFTATVSHLSPAQLDKVS